MSRRSLYLLLAAFGTVLPYVFFIAFFQTEGPGGDFVAALFVNGATGGFTVDLVVSSLAFWLFLFPEAHRADVRRPWIFLLLNLLIGLSCALPLFLWAREGALEGRA